MASDQNNQALFNAVQHYQQAPGQAIEALRPLDDAGDRRATALMAFFRLQQGEIDDALPLITQAVEAGYGELARLCANDLAQRGRPELRIRAPEFAATAIDQGWPVDVFGLILSSAAQGQPDVVAQLLEVASGQRPLAQRRQWEELIASVEADRKQVSSAAAAVLAKREEAQRDIDQHAKAVATMRQDLERQAEELGLLTSTITAENLADAYAEDAKRTEGQSLRYTITSLLVGAVSAAASIIGLLTVKEGSGFETVIAHAAFGLPFALLAAYINSLAASHRKEAWRLRHIELQIRTANPFLGLLDSERRRETLAALAVRFFPGQEDVNPGSADSGAIPLDLVDAITRLLREQHPVTAATTAPATPPPAQPPAAP